MTEAPRMTQRQRDLYEAIRAKMRAGYTPSVDELGKQFDVVPRTITSWFRELEGLGLMRRVKGKNRAIELLIDLDETAA